MPNSTNAILHIAADAGRIILENGGETYRAQETIDRIAHSYGMVEDESFAVPTGMMTTITDAEGNTLSHIRRITRRTINMEKISQINQLARDIAASPVPPANAAETLKGIDSLAGLSLFPAAAASGLIASFFTLFFGGEWRSGIVAFITGILLRLIMVALGRRGSNGFFINAVGGATAAFVAIMAAHFGIATSYDKIIIGAIMLLVPGITVVNAIRDAIAGDILAGTSRAVEAFILSVAIAMGTGAVLKIGFLLFGGL